MSQTHLDGGRLPLPDAAHAAPIPRRLVVFEGGAPVVKDAPLFSPATIKEVHTAALAELYSEPDDAFALEMGLPPSEFYGRTLLEVMAIKRARYAARSGDDDVFERILDRELGKPKTTSENHNINESYDEALNRIGAAEDARRAAAATPIDAQVAEPWEDLI